MKGRKPVPTHLKVLRGNPGKRPLNRNEPHPTPKAPGCPTWLPAEAKAEWRRIVPELDRIGMLTRVDRGALAAYCEAWSWLVRAEKEIADHGMVIYAVERDVTDEDGQTIRLYASARPNPAVRIAHQAATVIRQFCTEFGLTPSARARMTIPKPDDDSLKELLGPRRSDAPAR